MPSELSRHPPALGDAGAGGPAPGRASGMDDLSKKGAAAAWQCCVL